MPTKTKDWLRWHEKNIIKEEVGNWSTIDAGQIVRFNYKGQYARVKRPLVLILNPRWRGMLHGVSLDTISEAVLAKLQKIVQVTAQQRVAQLIRLRLPLLKADIKDPRRFYETRLRPFIKTNFSGVGNENASPYRTYIRGNMTNLRVIDYRFKDMYLGQPEDYEENQTASDKTRRR